MIDLYDLLTAFQGEVNPQQKGHIRPTQNYVKWLNAIQQEVFEDLAREWEKSQVGSDKLTPFLRSVNVALLSQPGQPFDIARKPDDYRYFSSARVLYSAEANATLTGCKCDTCPTLGENGQVRYEDPDEVAAAQLSEGSNYRSVPIRLLDNQRWDSAMRHPFKGPTLQEPKATAFDGGFKIAPKGIGIIVLDYLRPPKPVVFSYTTGTGGEIIYDQNGSTQLEWNTNVMPEFLARLTIKYGVYTRDQTAYQAGQVARNQTKS